MSATTTTGQAAPEKRPSATVIPFKRPTPSIPLDVLDGLERIQAELIDLITQLPREEAISDLQWGWIAPLQVALQFTQVSERRVLEISAGLLQGFEADPEGSKEVLKFLESVTDGVGTE